MTIARFIAPAATLLIASVLATPVTAGPAAVLEVLSSVTGSAGAWVHDFTITNNLPGENAIYFFGVYLPTGRSIVGVPPNYSTNFKTWTNSEDESAIAYNNVWIDFGAGIVPGTSLSGFKALDTGTVAATEIPYFIYAFGDEYYGPECWRCGSNPGFEGFANVSATTGAVPEPASWAMLIAGFGLTGAVARQRRRLAAA